MQQQFDDDSPDFTEEDFLYDSVNAQFHARVFFEQLLAHMFLPLAPFFANLHAQEFLSTSIYSNFFNILLPLIVYVMCISNVVMSQNDMDSVRGVVVLPLVLFTCHRIMIAIKFASLSETEYRKFMLCTSKQRCAVYLQQMHLLGDWYHCQERLMAFELGSASVRVAAKINEMTFALPAADHHNLQHWTAFLASQPGALVRAADQSMHATVLDTCKAILKQSYVPVYMERYVSRFVMLFALFIAIVPFATTPSGHMDNPAAVYTFLCCVLIVNLSFGNVNFLLLWLSIWDAARLVMMVRKVHAMVRLTDVMVEPEVSAMRSFNTFPEESDHRQRNVALIQSLLRRKPTTWMAAHIGVTVPLGLNSKMHGSSAALHLVDGPTTGVESQYARLPKIDLGFGRNVISWAYCRLTVQNFGDRFRLRMELFTSIVAIVAVSLIVATLVDIITVTDRLKEFRGCFVMQSVAFVTMVFIFFLVIAIIGSLANHQLSLHGRTLSLHVLRAKNTISDLKAGHYQHLQTQRDAEDFDDIDRQYAQEIDLLGEVVERMSSAMSVVQINTDMKPLRLQGYAIDSALAFSIIIGYVTYILILVSLYSSVVAE